MGCTVYVLAARLKGNISGLLKWETRVYAEIYLGYSTFYAELVALVLNPVTVHISPQFHGVFDDEFSTVKFMREGTITPNLIDLMQNRSQRNIPDNIILKDTCFTTDLEEVPRKKPNHKPSVATEN